MNILKSVKIILDTMELIKKFVPLYKRQQEKIIECYIQVWKDDNNTFICKIYDGGFSKALGNHPRTPIVTTKEEYCLINTKKIATNKIEMEGYQTLTSLGIDKTLSDEEKLILLQEKL